MIMINKYKKFLIFICLSIVGLIFFKYYLLDNIIFKEENEKINLYYSDGEKYILAIRNKDEDLLSNFYSLGKVSINYKDIKTQRSLLLWAFAYKNYDLAKKLIETGAEVNYVDPKTGLTALHFAVADNIIPLIKLLIAHGANSNLADKKYNLTPFDLAIKGNNKEIINLLKGLK